MVIAERPSSAVVLRPAPFGSRLFAYLLDWLVAFILTCVFVAAGGLILLVASDMGRNDPPDSALYAALLTAGMVAPVWVVVTIAGWTTAGRSVGKLALNLRIVDARGATPGIGRAIIRLMVGLVETVPLAMLPPTLTVLAVADSGGATLRLGSLAAGALLLPLTSMALAILSSERRALHDLAAGTRVIIES